MLNPDLPGLKEEDERTTAEEEEEEQTQGEDEELEKPEENILTEEVISECLSLLYKIGDGLSYTFIRLDCNNRDLTSISILENYIYLRIVDVSNNQLSNLCSLNFLPNLLSLKADKNIIEVLELESHPLLQYINMSNNKIDNINEGFSHPLIRHIDVSGNRIKDLIELDEERYPKLAILKAQQNAIQTITDINLPNLTTIALGYNKITDLQWVSNLINLEYLEVNNNNIDLLNGFNKNMKELKYIDLKENNIETYSEIEKLACLPSLSVFLLSDNPISKENEFRIEVLSLLTTLMTLNYSEVTEEERNEAYEVVKEREEEQSTQIDETST